MPTEELNAQAGDEFPPLPQAVLDFDQFLNEPPSYEEKRMVREYRHDAFPRWLKVVEAMHAYILADRKARAQADPGMPTGMLHSTIKAALLYYRCQHHKDDEGDGRQLSDLFTPPDEAAVANGLDEIELLTDFVWGEVDAVIRAHLAFRVAPQQVEPAPLESVQGEATPRAEILADQARMLRGYATESMRRDRPQQWHDLQLIADSLDKASRFHIEAEAKKGAA